MVKMEECTTFEAIGQFTCVNLFASRQVRISTRSWAHVMLVSGISGVSSSAARTLVRRRHRELPVHIQDTTGETYACRRSASWSSYRRLQRHLARLRPADRTQQHCRHRPKSVRPCIRCTLRDKKDGSSISPRHHKRHHRRLLVFTNSRQEMRPLPDRIKHDGQGDGGT